MDLIKYFLTPRVAFRTFLASYALYGSAQVLRGVLEGRPRQ